MAALASLALATIPCGVSRAALSPPEAAAPRVRFLDSVEKARKLAAKSGKPILLGFHAVWCPVCRRMQRETFPKPQVQGLADKFHWVSVDVDRQISVARAYKVRGSPEIMVLDARGKVRARYLGFYGPAKLRKHLDRVLSDLAGAPGRQTASVLYDVQSDERTNLTYTPSGYRGDAICFSHVGYGPLHLTSQSPFQSLRLGLLPRTPSTLARNQAEFR